MAAEYPVVVCHERMVRRFADGANTEEVFKTFGLDPRRHVIYGEPDESGISTSVQGEALVPGKYKISNCYFYLLPSREQQPQAQADEKRFTARDFKRSEAVRKMQRAPVKYSQPTMTDKQHKAEERRRHYANVAASFDLDSDE